MGYPQGTSPEFQVVYADEKVYDSLPSALYPPSADWYIVEIFILCLEHVQAMTFGT